MKNISLPFLTLVGTVGLAILVGCQLPNSRSGSTASAWNSKDKSSRLNDGQVADMQLALGRTFEQKKDYERALDAYAHAAEANPKCADAYWRQAVVHDKQGNTQESEALYRQALKHDSKNAELLCDYGYSLYLQRRWAESETYLRQATTLAPKNARAHTNLGLLCAQTDRTDDALKEFHKAGLDESDARSNLGLVLALNQRRGEALSAYQQAQAARPSSKVAKRGIEAIQVAESKVKSEVKSPTEATNQKSEVQVVKHEVEVAADAPPTPSVTDGTGTSKIKRKLKYPVNKPVVNKPSVSSD